MPYCEDAHMLLSTKKAWPMCIGGEVLSSSLRTDGLCLGGLLNTRAKLKSLFLQGTWHASDRSRSLLPVNCKWLFLGGWGKIISPSGKLRFTSLFAIKLGACATTFKHLTF